MAREYLILYPESNGLSNWGVFIGSNPVYIQLTDSNAFTLRPAPVRWTIRSAGGYNRRVQSGSFKTMITGSLNNMVVYSSQAASLWTTWLQPYSSGGVFDLPSYSIDHAIVMEDGSNTTIYKRYLGVKVGAWTFTSNADASLCRLSLTELVAKDYVNDTSFTETTYAQYPGGSSDPPYVHQHASGGSAVVTLGGVSRISTGFDQFTINVKHMLDPRFFNSTRISYLKYCGRDVDWSMTLPYIRKEDRNTLLENTGTGFGVTPTDLEVKYAIPPAATHSLDFKFESQNIVSSVSDSLDFNRLFMQTIAGWSQVDASATTDFAMIAS